MGGLSVSSFSEKIKYQKHDYGYMWEYQEKKPTICDICHPINEHKIDKLKSENEKLKKLVDFLEKELESLELKTAVSEKAVSLKTLVKEFTSTPAGQKAWQNAWDERAKEWKILVDEGKLSKIKYYRFINGMDQATLAKKLKTAQPNISRIEKPGYNVPVKTLEKLSKLFKVKKGDLIED